MPTHPQTVDQYLEEGCGRCHLGGTPQCKVQPWVEELRAVRRILQQSPLTEEIKWSVPCYTIDGKNILLLSALKDSMTLSFFRGVQMKDPENILVKPGKNSRFARYIRIKDLQTIISLENTLLDYIVEAIELERLGKPFDASLNDPLGYPDELLHVFEARPDFEKAFSSLTPGRQRGYLIYFTSAKQSKTKTARIEKCMPKIFAGKGWNER